MHNSKKIITFLPVSLIAVVALSGCSTETKTKRVLRVLNCEDYIYEAEQEAYWCDDCYDYVLEEDVKETTDEEGESYHYHIHSEEHEVCEDEEGLWYCETCEDYVDQEDVETSKTGLNTHHYEEEHFVEWDEDLMDLFVEYWAETHDGEEISYVYDTFDTNETMFNELKTGKTTYDIIVPSDYMIQKLISNNMLHKISEDNRDIMWSTISPFLEEKFHSIKDEVNHEEIYEYSVPYMWGTVGLMYNPQYYIDKGVVQSEEEVHELIADWDSLYGEKLSNSFSIKDSVRDTYAVSLVHNYRDEIALVDNNLDLTNIFNRHDEKAMADVKADMLKLKDNAFGFECDSGKTDMTTQKIGANMCWSGDATWAITEARDGDINLYYSVPTWYNGEEALGASNIWFDGLCMPITAKDEANPTEEELAQYELAEEFLIYLCDPEIAALNCDCIGYTPGVAGDAMLDYMYDLYDVRGEVDGEIPDDVEYVEYDLTYFFEGSLSDEYAEIEDVAVLLADPDMAKRELAAAYPEASQLDRLAIMNDFGTEGNARLLDMWESVRTNPLPTWAIILFVFEIALGIGLITYFVTKKVVRKKLKKQRV